MMPLVPFDIKHLMMIILFYSKQFFNICSGTHINFVQNLFVVSSVMILIISMHSTIRKQAQGDDT